MNFTSESHVDDNHLASYISIAFTVIGLYTMGLYLNIRMIKVSKMAKDMTWKLDITHAVIIIGLYTYNVLIHPTTYFIDDLYMYTGEWFCYTAKVISEFLLKYTGMHSTIIAAMKYVVIVHEEKIRLFKTKVKDTFIVLNVLIPIMSILLMVILVPNYLVLYEGHTHINRCFGNHNRNFTGWYNMCDLIVTQENHSSFQRILNNIKVAICKGNVIIFFLTVLNFFDVILYCRTFAFMRK